MKKVSLSGKYDLSGAGKECTACIPGDFHSALLKAGLIPDPYYAENESEVQWVGRTDWTIKRQFEFTVSSGMRTYLVLDGADTFFTVKINGTETGSGSNMFCAYRFDVTDTLVTGNNTIEIQFFSAEVQAAQAAKKLPYPVPYSTYPFCSPYRNLIRKVQCHGGWDWGPDLMVSGIYGCIQLETVRYGWFENATVRYHHKKDSTSWEVEVTAVYTALTPGNRQISFAISDGGRVIASEMLTAAVVPGSTALTATLTVENPEIWRTAGELAEEEKQENKRYDLSVTAGNDAEITHHIAFRTIELTAGEGSFGFRVNGRPVFAKGAAWIPADALPSRQTPERYKDLLTSAVQANMNMIRVWGGGQYEQEVFYDLCDRLGLMVWQDCMFACAMYPALPEFLASVEKELAYQVPRLQSHPCIALWCGNNENLGALSWFPESRENRDRYLIDYDRLYYGVVEKAVRTYDPDRAWWPSSPSGGEGVYSDNWHSDTRGDMHVWSVWHEKKSFDEYLTVRPLFVSEFGYESFPSVEEIQTYAPAAQMNMTSPVMEYHQRSAGGNSIILENFSRYFRFPEGFENMVYLSQVQQAVALRTAVEYWHSLRPHCSGTIYWQLNDVWPDASWSSLEYSGRWKLLHYAAKDFFAPVTLSLYKKDGMFRAFVINDTSGPVAGRVTVSCLRFDGYPAGKPVSVMVPVPAGSSVKVWELPEAELPGAPEKCFFYARLSAENSTGKQFSAENTLFPSLYKNCDLPAGKIAAEITASGSETFSIKLSATVPAFFTSLSSGEIRGIFSRNLFTLLPGMPVTVTFTPGKKHVTIETLRKALTVKTLRDSYSPEAIESVPAEEPARSR